MDKLTSTNTTTTTTTTNNNNTTVDELIDVLLDAIMRLQDLFRKPDDVACICNFVPRYIRPTTTTTMQEIYERRQASLERYRQQYALEHGNDDDDFEGGGEDEIDSGCGVSNKLEKNAHDLREHYDWYYNNNTSCSQ